MRWRQGIEADQPRYENRSQPTEDRVSDIVGKGDAGKPDLRWKRRNHDTRDDREAAMDKESNMK
jgi:hypothetical protein